MRTSMSKLTVALLMILLAGCKSAERAFVCNAVDSYKLGVHEICESSIRFNYCRCKKINLDTWTELTPFVDEEDTSKCDGLTGFKPNVWGKDLGLKFRALTRLKEERCNVTKK